MGWWPRVRARKGPCGGERPGVAGTDGQQSRVRANGSGVDADRVDGVRLDGGSERLGSHQKRVLCQDHVNGRISAERPDGFMPGIPAALERFAFGLLTCSFVCCPTVPELLVPTFDLSGGA